VARAGKCSATATSCTLSATATGDLNLFFAFRAGSTTPPTLPSGYTTVSTCTISGGCTTNSWLLYCKIASSSGDTGSGTATNATAVAGLSYSGTTVDSTNCAPTATQRQVGSVATGSTTVSYGAVSPWDNVNDWVVAFMGDSTSGQTCVPGTLTNESATGDVLAADSNASVSSFSTGTCTVTSSAWESVTMELNGPNPAAASTPALKRSWGYTGLTSNQVDTADAIKLYLEQVGPRITTAGDMLVLALKNPVANTATITDSASDTWATALTCSDSNSKYTLFYAANIAAESSWGSPPSITITFGSKVADIQFALFLFYGTATSSPIDGSGICTTGITPANNIAPNISSGSFTPGTSGDLIINQVFNNGHPAGLPHATTDSVYGSGFTGLYGEIYMGAWAQYQVQSTAAAINPGLTVVQATHDTFASMSIAVKQGSGGTAPGNGISIIRSQTVYLLGVTGTTVLPFSTPPGHLIVAVNDAGTNGTSLTGVTDSQANTYTAIACTGGCTGIFPQVFYAANAIANNSNHVSLTTSGSGNDLIALEDLAGAATSPLDTAATAANSSTLTGTSSGATSNFGTQSGGGASFSDASSITPSAAGEFIIASMNIGTGPSTGCTGVAGTVNGTYDYNTATFETSGGDQNAITNGDGMCHYYDATTATVDFGYSMGNTAAQAWQAIAVAFKAAPSGSVPAIAHLGAGPT
jgi:hypothetical protein